MGAAGWCELQRHGECACVREAEGDEDVLLRACGWSFVVTVWVPAEPVEIAPAQPVGSVLAGLVEIVPAERAGLLPQSMRILFSRVSIGWFLLPR